MVFNERREGFVNWWGQDPKVELPWLFANGTENGDEVDGLAGESTPNDDMGAAGTRSACAASMAEPIILRTRSCSPRGVGVGVGSRPSVGG